MDSALYWTPDVPAQGWRLLQNEGGGWRAEQLGGPQLLGAASLTALVKDLAGEDEALQRRYTETRIRAAAIAAGTDPDALVTALRASERA